MECPEIPSHNLCCWNCAKEQNIHSQMGVTENNRNCNSLWMPEWVTVWPRSAKLYAYVNIAEKKNNWQLKLLWWLYWQDKNHAYSALKTKSAGEAVSSEIHIGLRLLRWTGHVQRMAGPEFRRGKRPVGNQGCDGSTALPKIQRNSWDFWSWERTSRIREDLWSKLQEASCRVNTRPAGSESHRSVVPELPGFTPTEL